MQSSAMMGQFNFNYEKADTFKYYCKKLNIIHYSTRGKYLEIEKHWELIFQEIKKNNINITDYHQLIDYLQQQYHSIDYTKKFCYENIIRELSNYSRLAVEFSANMKNYIYRLKAYAKHRNCTTMEEIKHELDSVMKRFSVSIDENSKNTYDTQEWLIISRYICDYLEYDDGQPSSFILA